MVFVYICTTWCWCSHYFTISTFAQWTILVSKVTDLSIYDQYYKNISWLIKISMNLCHYPSAIMQVKYSNLKPLVMRPWPQVEVTFFYENHIFSRNQLTQTTFGKLAQRHRFWCMNLKPNVTGFHPWHFEHFS